MILASEFLRFVMDIELNVHINEPATSDRLSYLLVEFILCATCEFCGWKQVAKNMREYLLNFSTPNKVKF